MSSVLRPVFCVTVEDTRKSPLVGLRVSTFKMFSSEDGHPKEFRIRRGLSVSSTQHPKIEYSLYIPCRLRPVFSVVTFHTRPRPGLCPSAQGRTGSALSLLMKISRHTHYESEVPINNCDQRSTPRGVSY